MSWESIFKATTSKSAKLVWPSMKKLIDKFFEGSQDFTVSNLRNYLIDNLDNQLQEDRPDISNKQRTINVSQAIKDLRIVGGRSKYMDQKVPRYIKATKQRARVVGEWNPTLNAQVYGDTYLPIEKSWDSTLKSKATEARRLVEKTIKEMVGQFVEGKDKIFTDDLKQHIIDNLKAEHIKRHSVDGKVSNTISSQPTRYIKHKLETTFPTKIIPMAKSFGYGIVYGRPSRGKPTYLIKKSDSWESMTDSMIAEGKLFEAIYTAILQKFKFSAPSKEKVVAYLNANYERHPLFSNKWSTKSEGEGQ
tara:strand:+ start:9093 stop:10007 length:915 start_codon:yes stop_codon:yes gene_type:complete